MGPVWGLLGMRLLGFVVNPVLSDTLCARLLGAHRLFRRLNKPDRYGAMRWCGVVRAYHPLRGLLRHFCGPLTVPGCPLPPVIEFGLQGLLRGPSLIDVLPLCHHYDACAVSIGGGGCGGSAEVPPSPLRESIEGTDGGDGCASFHTLYRRSFRACLFAWTVLHRLMP